MEKTGYYLQLKNVEFQTKWSTMNDDPYETMFDAQVAKRNLEDYYQSFGSIGQFMRIRIIHIDIEQEA